MITSGPVSSFATHPGSTSININLPNGETLSVLIKLDFGDHITLGRYQNTGKYFLDTDTRRDGDTESTRDYFQQEEGAFFPIEGTRLNPIVIQDD